MKTKDFIKMLQEADPSGELHVRFRDSGAPWFAESMPGYYDGCYSYYENDILTLSTKGSKVDIYTQDWQDIVWDENGDLEKIRKRIKFELDGNREKEWIGRIEQEAEKAKESHEKLNEEYTEKVLEEMKKNIKYIEYKDPKKNEWGHGFAKFLNDKKENICCGEIRIIQENIKVFRKIDKGDYYEYENCN